MLENSLNGVNKMATTENHNLTINHYRSELILKRITFGLLEGWLASQWVLVGKVGSGHPNGKK
jgi:hypothetical protein